MVAHIEIDRKILTAPAFVIEPERSDDIAAREALLDAAMGLQRLTKTSEKIRRGRLPAEGLAFVARDAAGRLVGTVRLWDIAAGVGRNGRPVPALLLGPLAVLPEAAGLGIGTALMSHAISRARALRHGAILLVGDAPYYGRFGFSAGRTAMLMMPGPFERERFLGLELEPGALGEAAGIVVPTGRSDDAYGRGWNAAASIQGSRALAAGGGCPAAIALWKGGAALRMPAREPASHCLAGWARTGLSVPGPTSFRVAAMFMSCC